MMRPVAECNASVGAPLLSRLQAALNLGQSTRLLQIETALPSASLVVERCRITEAVHATEPLWAEVDCVSTHALLELKALNGEQVTLRLMLADGSWRATASPWRPGRTGSRCAATPAFFRTRRPPTS